MIRVKFFIITFQFVYKYFQIPYKNKDQNLLSQKILCLEVETRLEPFLNKIPSEEIIPLLQSLCIDIYFKPGEGPLYVFF